MRLCAGVFVEAPAFVAASPAVLLTDDVLRGAVLEEEGAAEVRAEVVDGREAEDIDVRDLMGLVTAGKDARDAVEDASVERRSDEVEAVFACAAGRDVGAVLEVDMRFDRPFIAFLLSSPDVRLPLIS